jgi:hypothetical protein
MPKPDTRYVVKYRAFRPTNDENDWTYAPDGEAYECTREQALARFDALVIAGQLGVPVCGLVPFHVRIEDVQIPSASTKKPEPMRNVMLSRYVPDDESVGPWARELVAA